MIAGLAGDIGKGLVAGAIGTAAMTASSSLEARLRDRGSSSTPADAAAAVLGVRPTEDGEERFNQLAHWGYGTSLGTIRGVIGWMGFKGTVGNVLHLGAIWGLEQVVLPATDASPPATEWGAQEIAIDLVHHTVYAATTGMAYSWLARH